MASITQNADGSYSKSYSDLELSLVKGLVDEAKLRQQGDQELWVDVTGVANRLQVLEDTNNNYTFLQEEVVRIMKELEKSREDLSKLDLLLGVDSYSKDEIDRLMVLWFVEQIPHVFAQPRSSMFDLANIDEIKSGYKGYLMANINEPHDNHIPENIMQRYTINAFMEVPGQVTFQVSFADRCTFVLNGTEEGTWADAGGNFSSVPKVLVLDLKEGWNKIEIMIANETQRGGLVITSDLYDKAAYLHNLSNFAGMITGSRIAPGTIDETHLSPNMDLVVNTVHATAENVPAVIVGNPEACGILQIGDKTISKCIDEPFVFDDGIRVNGYIYVSQLLIDKDFVLEGDGIFIEKQIDVTTGFTEAYIIHNDMVINNGGGLTIVGDARKGYTITNAMQLIVDGDLNDWDANPYITEGGLDISGDAVKGYYIRNSMMLTVEGTGGLEVMGNGHDGYYIKNTMNLSTAKGLEVIGDPSEAAGYKLRNKMTMTGSGVKLTGSMDDQSYYNWDIENDTKITPQCLATNNDATTAGGLSVIKNAAGEFLIGNAMKFTVNNDGPAKITGDACSGYKLDVKWPTITQMQGIAVHNDSLGVYRIENTGIISIGHGNKGISVSTRDPQGKVLIYNEGVIEINDGTDIDIDDNGNGEFTINSKVKVTSGSSNVSVNKSGSDFQVAVTQPPVVSVASGSPNVTVTPMSSTVGVVYYVSVEEPPPQVIPDPPEPEPEDPPPYQPPPSDPGTGSLSYSGGVSNGKLSKYDNAGGNDGPDGSQYNGLASGAFEFNDDNSLTISFDVWHGGNTAGHVYVFAVPTPGSTDFLVDSKTMIGISITSGNKKTISKTFTKTQIGRNDFYLAVGIDTYAHQEDDIWITIQNSGTFS